MVSREFDFGRRKTMEIRSNVPLPPNGNSKPRTEHGRKIRELAVGQMMFDEDEEIIHRARYLAISLGIKVSMRKCTIEGKRGWGLWRTA